ncbi:MAG TPA: STAS domain-containing protein [Usitatibacter sp.]|nr:STAS domain-containing protein [Usitatibacter sp.]
MQSANQLQSERVGGVQGAALLFSANLADAAIGELEDCLRSDPARDPRAWTMLFELCSAKGRLDTFEEIAARHSMPFGAAKVPRRAVPVPVELASTVSLKGTLAGADDLRGLYMSARERKIIAVDMGDVERIDYSYAGAFAASLKALNACGKRVILVNLPEVHAVLLEMLGAHKHVALMRRKSALAEEQPLAA